MQAASSLGFMELTVTIGKPLIQSPAFPLLHTGRASFPASGVPSK
jgi:hypothetical protein